MENNKKIYLKRIVDDKISTYLECFGAICVEGPKWCGKTWTSNNHSNSSIYLADPRGNFNNRRLALMNPSLILSGDSPRLIDEWQEVPPLWDAIRYEVDSRGRKGQFILTGSSTPKRDGIIHSGAGRIASIRMRTMSLFESGDSSGLVSLKDICDGKDIQLLTEDVSLEKLAELIIRGGWPANLSVSKENQRLLPREYIRTILDNEIFATYNKKYNVYKMELLLKSLARNESTTPTRSKLISDISVYGNDNIDSDTIATYLNIFESMFLIENQKPFSPNVRSSIRVKQKEKIHFCDPSLACALLGLSKEMLINDLETFGFLFEALVEHDLRIYADSFNGKLYHYQNYNNDEIDAVIELENGEWIAVEIKLGANQIDKASKGLIRIKNKIDEAGGKPPKEMVVVCGLSNAAYKRPDGVYVVPITALKQ